MLLTIACNGPESRELSWLLHKHPDRFQSYCLPYGRAYVFFPEYADTHCKVCLLLSVESDGLNDVCKAKDGEFQYVNPRQYLGGSLFSGALAKVFFSALKGICGDRPDLVNKQFDLDVEITNFSCRINREWIEKLFSPLGYETGFTDIAGPYSCNTQQFGNLALKTRSTLQSLLAQLFILLPVFDKQLHFWIGESQVGKFIRHASGWLEEHPEKRFIINGYFWPAPELRFRVLEHFGSPALSERTDPALNAVRQREIVNTLVRHDAKSVLDLGCGNGSLLAILAEERKFSKLSGMDISARNIEDARSRLCAPGKRLCTPDNLFIGSLTYRDKRIAGYDALVLSEVIEHFEPERMELVMRNILAEARPGILVLTTPNRDYNAAYNLNPDEIRHPDHRYEFNEPEFNSFCQKFASQFGYDLEISSIGDIHPDLGSPTLMGTFKRCA